MKTLSIFKYAWAIIALMLLSLQSCDTENRDFIYFTESAKVNIYGVYVGPNPVSPMINGQPIEVPLTYGGKYSDVIKTGSIDIESYYKLKENEDVLTFSLQDTLTKKEIYSAVLEKNTEGVYTLDFALLNGKQYKKGEYISTIISPEVINLSQNKIEMTSDNIQIEGFITPPPTEYQDSKSERYYAYFGNDELDKNITFTLTNKKTREVLGKKSIRIGDLTDNGGDIYASADRIQMLVLPHNYSESMMMLPQNLTPDPNTNQFAIYFHDENLWDNFDLRLVTDMDGDLGLMGENLAPNQWETLSLANQSFFKDWGYNAVFYTTGTMDPYLSDDPWMNSISSHSVDFFPEDDSNGAVGSYVIYRTQHGSIQVVKL